MLWRDLRVLALAVLVGTPASTRAQCYDAYLVGWYDGAVVQLRLNVGQRTFANVCRYNNVVAFDVFRTALGPQCGPDVRITDQPIPWPAQPDNQTVVLELEDPGVVANTGYRYEARPVDAERNPAGGLEPIYGYAVVGVAPMIHGEVHPECGPVTPCLQVAGVCPDECFAWGIVRVPDELSGQVGTGTPLLLYVNAVTVTGPLVNQWWPVFSVVSGRIAPCVVAVAPLAWGSVKRLYR